MKKFHYVTRETDEIIFLYHSDKGIYTANGEAYKNTMRKGSKKIFAKKQAK